MYDEGDGFGGGSGERKEYGRQGGRSIQLLPLKRCLVMVRYSQGMIASKVAIVKYSDRGVLRVRTLGRLGNTCIAICFSDRTRFEEAIPTGL